MDSHMGPNNIKGENYDRQFKEISSDCKIYVPSVFLSAYQSAINWSTYASQMVGE